jgi:hypothetical protein
VDSHQAKEILLLYRDGIDRPDDPEFAAALALANNDADLGHWLEHQQMTHKLLRAKFKEIVVPEGLKEQIISERRVHTTFRFKKKLAFASAIIAIALLLISIFTTFDFFPKGEDKYFSGFRTRMVRTAVGLYPKMDLETSDLASIHEFLTQRGHGDYTLPSPLARTTGTGCKLLSWQGHPVSMVCFNSGGTAPSTKPDLFLFVMNEKFVPDPSAAKPSDIVQVSTLATVGWTRNGKIYLLGALGTSARAIQNTVAANLKLL